MKIRTKLPLFISIMMGLYILGLLSMMAILTATSFQQTENMIALADLKRALNAIDRETESLRSISQDYGQWDDTWAFAQGKYPEYVETNFSPETYKNLNLGFIAIFNASGTCVFSGRNSVSGIFETDATALPSLGDSPELMRIASAGGRFLFGASSIILCQASAITKNDGSGPVAGFFVVGKFFDEQLFRKLSDQTGVAIDFLAAGSPLLPPEESFSASENILKPSSSGDTMHAFHIFQVNDGHPGFFIRTSTDRAVTRKGTEISLSIALVSLCFTAILTILSWLAFSRWLNQPLALMERILNEIDLDDPKRRAENPFSVLERRADEIGHVSSALAAMHSRLGSAYDQIREANDTLEAQVAARTASLSAANHNLELYRRILENATEGIIVTDLDGTITEVNDAQCRMAGLSREELLGKNPRLMKSDRHDGGFYATMWSAILADGNWAGEIWNRRQQGEVYPKWLSITAIYDDSGKPEKYVGVSTDISVIKRAEKNLQQLAFYDPLTGLPNRSLFANRLEHALAVAERENGRIGLLFLDLDRFKNINDTMGHAAGDDLLIKAAERIKSTLRETDTVCRIGGDEFTIILDKVKNESDPEIIAGKLVGAMSEKFELNGTDVYIGASVGISRFPKDGRDSETLLKKADMAMYYAKESGRGRWSLATGEIDSRTKSRMETESRLRGALDRNEFALFYQAQTSVSETRAGSNSGLQGAEALLRWIPRTGEVISPETFVDVAEDIGLIVPIGAWVLTEACREAKRWSDSGKAIQVSVNVSIRQFEEGKLPALVARALSETGLPPKLLKLEITESMLMRNVEKVLDIIKAIRELGVQFSIDDFGTGYSSLHCLSSLPLDSLKIDKAFIDKLADGDSSREIVTVIISMARAFGLSSIAEGVETQAQLDALKSLGCQAIQGYFVSQPLPAEAFREFLLAKTV